MLQTLKINSSSLNRENSKASLPSFRAVFLYFLYEKRAANPEPEANHLPISKSHPSELTASALTQRDEGAFDQISEPVSRSVVGCPLSRGEK